ncbi:MAG: L,D-transpeptidase family protein [Alphaproteobacteria bacterium]
MKNPRDILTIHPLSLGRGGVGSKQKEGDGITPIGDYKILSVLYRPDKLARPDTSLPTLPIAKNAIWVDDPASPDYNQQLCTDHYPYHHEKLWRNDDIYDLLAVLDYNHNPIIKGKGSAIFIHLARPNLTPTEGCIAIARHDFYQLIKIANQHSLCHIDKDSIYLTR